MTEANGIPNTNEMDGRAPGANHSRKLPSKRQVVFACGALVGAEGAFSHVQLLGPDQANQVDKATKDTRGPSPAAEPK